MAFADSIDYQQTLDKHKLVLKTQWLDIIDRLIFFLLSSLFLIYIILTFKDLTPSSNPNDSAIAYGILPLIALSVILLSYKKAREKKLLTITTEIGKSEARRIIKQAFLAWGWKIHADRAAYLQATTGLDYGWGKQVTVLFEDKKLHLNVISNNPMVRMPVLFSDKSIKYRVEKLLHLKNPSLLTKNI